MYLRTSVRSSVRLSVRPTLDNDIAKLDNAVATLNNAVATYVRTYVRKGGSQYLAPEILGSSRA